MDPKSAPKGVQKSPEVAHGSPSSRSRRPGDRFEESKVDAEAAEVRSWLSERILEDFATMLDYLGQAPTCVSYRKIQYILQFACLGCPECLQSFWQRIRMDFARNFSPNRFPEDQNRVSEGSKLQLKAKLDAGSAPRTRLQSSCSEKEPPKSPKKAPRGPKTSGRASRGAAGRQSMGDPWSRSVE